MFFLKGVRFKEILDIAELQIPARKITCITGESGSGKTTLLKLLNGLISPDRGEIRYSERKVEDWDPIRLRREVVMLSQSPVIFPGTVKENLLIGLEFAEKPPVLESELLQALDKVRLQKKLTENASLLSGGEKQRLALCRVLLLQPEVMLLDEPTSSLDDDTGELIMEQVVRYAREKSKTIVVVTHDKMLSQQYGEFVLTVEKGRISGAEVLS
jgi:putative ABC transport system ATP-binding protein